MKIALIAGGRSREREISLKTGRGVEQALKQLGHDVTRMDMDRSSISRLISKHFDLVFLALHGQYGEDGKIQGMLEILEIPYTGSGVLSSAIAMNKPCCQRLVKLAGVRIPQNMVLRSDRNIEKNEQKMLDKIFERGNGWVIKPIEEGSSFGMEIVQAQKNFTKKLNQVFTFSDKALIEEHIEGTEITVGVLGNNNPCSLPPVEICPRGKFFDFSSKYQKGETEYFVPARIPESVSEEAKNIALRVHRLLECRGLSRSDFIIKRDEIYFLEINTLPGMTETSLIPRAAEAEGMSYMDLVQKIIEFSMEEKNETAC